MPYSHLRMIGYRVPTMAEMTHGDLIYGLPAGTLPVAQKIPMALAIPPTRLCNLELLDIEALISSDTMDFAILKGSPENIKAVKADKDLHTRILRLFCLMELAQYELDRKKARKDGVLNVFLLPEFYFRPPQDPYSYSKATYRAIRDVLTQTITTNRNLTHWLVIPGTIMWTDTQRLQLPDEKAPTEVRVDRNTALVLSGWGGSVTSQDVEKDTPSGADGLPSLRLEKELGKPQDDWMSYDVFMKRAQRVQSYADHVFTHRGINFGIEICKDHGLLKSNRDVTGNIVAQLLVSCGKAIRSTSVAVEPDGMVVRCDGYPSAGVRADKRTVRDYDVKNDTRWDSKSSAVLSPSNLDLQDERPKTVDHEISFGKDHSFYWAKPPKADQDKWDLFNQGLTIFKEESISTRHMN